MLACLSATAGFTAPAGVRPTVAPRVQRPAMEVNPDWFPTKGQGKAIPFLMVPPHLDGTMAGDNGARWPPAAAACRRGLTPEAPLCRQASTRSTWAAPTT